MKITAQSKFNDGKTTIIMAQNAMNMWMVWREDNGHQALVKQYTAQNEAWEDYNHRIDFIKQVTQA